MDILTHAISGMAIATCSASFVKTTPIRKAKVFLCGFIGGIMPDLDAISMWSGFDPTFGKIFKLHDSGKVIYSSKLWYSHHAFLHSLLASILLAILCFLFLYLAGKVFKRKKTSPIATLKNNSIYFITFILAFWMHLGGDIPTPSATWGGISLFWPSQNYIGGYGKIWWWNNYDLFLIILSAILINLTVPLFFKYIRKKSKIFTSTILGLSFIAVLVQINTRQYNYAYERHTPKYAEMEINSKKEQKRILGIRLYTYMEWFDSKLKFFF